MTFYDPGLYVFRITKQGWTETKDRKLPMLVFEGYPTHLVRKDPEGNEVLEEVYCDPNYPERTLRLTVDSNNDDMMDFVVKKLRHAGWEGDSFASLNLVNTDIRAVCEQGEYKGKQTEDWDFALPPLDREVNELDPAMNRKLDTLFGKRLKGGKPKQASPEAQTEKPPETAEPAAVSQVNDEIPF